MWRQSAEGHRLCGFALGQQFLEGADLVAAEIAVQVITARKAHDLTGILSATNWLSICSDDSPPGRHTVMPLTVLVSAASTDRHSDHPVRCAAVRRPCHDLPASKHRGSSRSPAAEMRVAPPGHSTRRGLHRPSTGRWPPNQLSDGRSRLTSAPAASKSGNTTQPANTS